jgi:hypothetical protein
VNRGTGAGAIEKQDAGLREHSRDPPNGGEARERQDGTLRLDIDGLGLATGNPAR